MRDSRELALSAAILVVAFLAAPLVIDRIQMLAAHPRWLKIALCFVFSGVAFVVVVLAWWVVLKLKAKIPRRGRKDGAE